MKIFIKHFKFSILSVIASPVLSYILVHTAPWYNNYYAFLLGVICGAIGITLDIKFSWKK